MIRMKAREHALASLFFGTGRLRGHKRNSLVSCIAIWLSPAIALATLSAFSYSAPSPVRLLTASAPASRAPQLRSGISGSGTGLGDYVDDSAVDGSELCLLMDCSTTPAAAKNP